MATDAYFKCTKCRQHSYPSSLFAALRLVAETGIEPCPMCEAMRELHLDFAFATDGPSRRRCTVWKAFLPSATERPTWKQGGKTVEFFPFLVFLNQAEPYDRAVWLPYWHVKRSRSQIQTLFGQWAPFMDHHLYASLLRQARASGCLK